MLFEDRTLLELTLMTISVRREDLYDSSADEDDVRDDETDAILREKLNAQLSGLLGVSFTHTSDDVQQPQQEPDDPGGATGDHGEDLAFSFRLFRDEAPSHKVILERDETLEQAGGGGFVVAKRPTSYYVAEAPAPDTMAKFRSVAVTADHLFQDARQRRWGLEKPWRVTRITVTDGTLQRLEGHVGDATAGRSADRRKRPGKRRRIMLRTREKAKKERAEAEKLKLVEKEQYMKDKKKRLNREKKLKRRAKEREKKLATKEGEDDGVGSDQDSGKDTSPE